VGRRRRRRRTDDGYVQRSPPPATPQRQCDDHETESRRRASQPCRPVKMRALFSHCHRHRPSIYGASITTAATNCGYYLLPLHNIHGLP